MTSPTSERMRCGTAADAREKLGRDELVQCSPSVAAPVAHRQSQGEADRSGDNEIDSEGLGGWEGLAAGGVGDRGLGERNNNVGDGEADGLVRVAEFSALGYGSDAAATNISTASRASDARVTPRASASSTARV